MVNISDIYPCPVLNDVLQPVTQRPEDLLQLHHRLVPLFGSDRRGKLKDHDVLYHTVVFVTFGTK